MARSSIYPPSVTPGIPRLGERPDGWLETTYGDVLEKHTRKAEIQDEQKYQLVTAKRSRGGIVPRSQLYGKEIKTEAQFYICTDDFLISKRQIIHGACGIVPAYLDGAIVSGEYSVLRVKSGLLLDYLKYHCHTVYFQQTCFQSSVGVDVEKMIFDLDQWLKFAVYLPPIPEQHKLAAILSTWDEAIDLTQQLIAAKQQRKQALMQRLLTGKVRFPGFEEEWPLVTFGEVFTFLRTAAFSRSDLTYEIKDDSVFNIHYGDIHSTYSSDILDLSNEESVPKVRDNGKLARDVDYLNDGDLVIADVSEDYAGVGICVEVANIEDRKVTSGLHTFAVRDKAGLTTQGYRCYILKAPQVAKKLRQLATGVSVHGISKSNISNLQFHLPSLLEQRKIAIVLASCNEEIEALQQKLAAIQQQKQGLMQQLLTGKIRVKV